MNEYLNPCEVIRKGQRDEVPPMEALETIVIDGVPLKHSRHRVDWAPCAKRSRERSRT